MRICTTEIIRQPDHDGQQTFDLRGMFAKLFQSPPTVAELSKEEFVAYRAVSQGNCFRRVS